MKNRGMLFAVVALLVCSMLVACGGGGSSSSTNTAATGGSVSSTTLQSLTVSPASVSLAAGLSQTYVAYATFGDGSVQDYTSHVTWTSSDNTIATMAGATATGHRAGSATITATSGSTTGTATLTVTQASVQQLDITPDLPTIDIGSDLQFTATATFSDSTTGPVAAAWTSSVAGVATIDGDTGMAHGVATGTSDIHAAFSGQSDVTTVTVTSARLVSIKLTPAAPTLAKGTTQQFTATGTFDDGSTQDLLTPAWSSDNPSIASIDAATGLATAVAAGTAHIIATGANGVTGNATVTVTNAALSSIAITPANPTVGTQATVQFTATGTFNDGSTQDLTTSAVWKSSNGQVATITAAGLATTLTQGTATISATFGTITGSTPLTVSAATLRSIDVKPDVAQMVPRARLQMHAIGTFSDNSTRELAGVNWSSSKPRVGSISNSGVLRSKHSGQTTVRASLGGISGTEVVTVTDLSVSSIAVTPASASIATGATQQFTATGTLSNGSTVDLTLAVRWTTSAYSVATISSAGVATGVASGNATVTATYAGQTSTATLTVH